MASNQRGKFQQAIRNRKARIAEIDAILHRPVPVRQPGPGFRPSAAGRRKLAIEREHHLEVVNDLEQQLTRVITPPPRICSTIAQASAPAAELAQASHANVTKGRAKEAVPLRRPALPKYKSKVKLASRRILLDNPEPQTLSVMEICRRMDDDAVEFPDKWKRKNIETFDDAYHDPKIRQRIHRVVDKVKADLKRGGLL